MGAATRAARDGSPRFHIPVKGRSLRDLARSHSEPEPSTKRRAEMGDGGEEGLCPSAASRV
jgi:hypothetical protein